MTRKSDKAENKAAQELKQLLNRCPPEEEIHQFFAENILKIGHGNPRLSERFIAGAISKFPITPDRIADFASAVLKCGHSQTPSRLTFIELKKADSVLFTGHSRMSKDLNDAWMECVESSRLMADNFRDCLRRIVKTLKKDRLDEFNRSIDEDMPFCNSVIVIGRRSSLDSDGLRRTKELSASTGYGIRVITYDTVLDWIAEADEDSSWSFFDRGWYW
jgi:hypothetical protein